MGRAGCALCFLGWALTRTMEIFISGSTAWAKPGQRYGRSRKRAAVVMLLCCYVVLSFEKDLKQLEATLIFSFPPFLEQNGDIFRHIFGLWDLWVETRDGLWHKSSRRPAKFPRLQRPNSLASSQNVSKCSGPKTISNQTWDIVGPELWNWPGSQ